MENIKLNESTFPRKNAARELYESSGNEQEPDLIAIRHGALPRSPRAVCPHPPACAHHRPCNPQLRCSGTASLGCPCPWAGPAAGAIGVGCGAVGVPAARKPGVVLLWAKLCLWNRGEFGHLCQLWAGSTCFLPSALPSSLPPILSILLSHSFPPSLILPLSLLPLPFPPSLPLSFLHSLLISKHVKHKGHNGDPPLPHPHGSVVWRWKELSPQCAVVCSEP